VPAEVRRPGRRPARPRARGRVDDDAAAVTTIATISVATLGFAAAGRDWLGRIDDHTSVGCGAATITAAHVDDLDDRTVDVLDHVAAGGGRRTATDHAALGGGGLVAQRDVTEAQVETTLRTAPPLPPLGIRRRAAGS
jgi:hypothetical protein